MEVSLIIQEIVRILRRYLSDEYRIFLFGSWAKGIAHSTSDIDIGIMGSTKVPAQTLSRILIEVDSIPTLRSIEIVDLMNKSESFQTSVLQTAKEIGLERNLQLA
ncbi:MAG: nucleotidyltransferase domain-containing protein [Ignavibacteriae bacterium]|nr:nucleotidyltransferase domain-containing protein [Ignavibacteriota bacterium]